jgi:hypothetical protein
MRSMHANHYGLTRAHIQEHEAIEHDLLVVWIRPPVEK